VEKIMTGLEKKSRVMNPEERKVIAYHEAGHALVAAFTPDSDPVQKVTIVPRGFGALGFTLQVPIEDRYIVTQDKLIGEIDVLLGGRAAEDIVFGKISTGASNDITRATDIARRMITDYGMSERYRNVALTKRGAGLLGPGNEQVMAREYGEETQKYIDESVAAMLALRYEEAKRILTEQRTMLVAIAEELLDKESIDEARFKELVRVEA
jgi:cell division protease FtsH